LKEDPTLEVKKARQEWEEEQEKEAAALKSQGLDPEKEKILNTTASEAEWRESLKNKKKGDEFSWDRKCLITNEL
jgi:hypothetical protein